jgi:hypothetical protein
MKVMMEELVMLRRYLHSRLFFDWLKRCMPKGPRMSNDSPLYGSREDVVELVF